MIQDRMQRVGLRNVSSGAIEARAMQARTSTGAGLLTQMLAQRLRRSAMALAEGCRKLVGETTYRPEKHYMRGPGPKWRAKYARAEADDDAARGQSPQDATRGS
jgi:hypothetical protein